MTANDVSAAAEVSVEEGFRLAMRRLVATMTIVAAGEASSRAGMVATAVMSVSTKPPSLVVGVNREAGVWRAIADTQRFSVNLLETEHAPLVMPFSGQLQGEERFQVGEWHSHRLRTPYLARAVASLFCRVDGELDYGTHTLFIGAVEDVYLRAEGGEPLLWREGSFANAVPMGALIE